ncbi:MAG: CPBP family intramembrane metalloprotease [Methanobrevibacter sp.]|jgi:membrane protease YdiL (CAAX protease family)|nr:CPBP family intramembrane metalloprotease [Methanobrevibacter sp.]
MVTRFLDNVRIGKNSGLSYFTTIILSMFISSFVALYYLLFILGFYYVLTGAQEVASTTTTEAIYFFVVTFLSFGASFLFLSLSINVFHKRDLISLINTSKKFKNGVMLKWYKRIRWGRLLKGAGVWSVVMIVYIIVPYIIDPSKFIFQFNLNNFLILCGLFLLAIPIQASFEELFFRGYLNQGLSLKIKRPLVIILISSFIFGLGHTLNGDLSWYSMFIHTFSAFIVGIIWSLMTLVDEGIELSSGAHIANNFFAFVIIGVAGSPDNFGTVISQTADISFNFEFVWSFLPLILFLIAYIIYKRKEIKRVLKIGKPQQLQFTVNEY